MLHIWVKARPTHLLTEAVSQHGVRLATAGLAVSDDCGIVVVEAVVRHGPSGDCKKGIHGKGTTLLLPSLCVITGQSQDQGSPQAGEPTLEEGRLFDAGPSYPVEGVRGRGCSHAFALYALRQLHLYGKRLGPRAAGVIGQACAAAVFVAGVLVVTALTVYLNVSQLDGGAQDG